MEATHSSETSVHNKPTRRHIPEDGGLHSHRREYLKPYILILSSHLSLLRDLFPSGLHTNILYALYCTRYNIYVQVNDDNFDDTNLLTERLSFYFW
jgi:hypothetical protein